MSDERYKLNTTGALNAEQFITMKNGKTTFTFLQSGDLFEITHNDMMINQIRGNMVDGSMNNIWLRVYDEEGNVNAVTPLLGVSSASEFKTSDNQVVYTGDYDDISYVITLTLQQEGIWFYDVEVDAKDKTVDLLFTQDVGLASRGMIQSNEAYTSQYVDYQVFEDDVQGYVVCARQNQPQGTDTFPYLQLGALTKATSYSTDGYQFFGLDYKSSDVPVAVFDTTLADEVYQYEFGYVVLKSEVKSGTVKETFYGVAKDTQLTAVTSLDYLEEVQAAYNGVSQSDNYETVETVAYKENMAFPLESDELTQEEINTRYPVRLQEEFDGETLLSFFTPTYEHVVLKEKEMRVERSHGHILLSGKDLTINDDIITTTNYMYGVFNAQIVIGNTTMNKMMSNARNGLNVMKTSGQRIYVKGAFGYQLLTMPALYEMGFNYAKWVYKLEDDVITVTNFTATNASDIVLTVTSEKGVAYQFMVTNQVIMNEKEYEVPFRMSQSDNTLTFKVTENGFVANYYPELTYHLTVHGTGFDVTDERALLDGVKVPSASLVVLELEATAEFKIHIEGRLNGEDSSTVMPTFEEEVTAYREHFKTTMNGFNLSQKGEVTRELEKFNVIAWWYTHNMFVHYLVPHGIEQYGGAAWGTRDVCQGPFEYFLAMGRHEVMREILLTVFSHQFEDDGNWPQWFMFDKYVNIHAGDAHGDIIAWPLYVIGTYLNVTGDYSILEEQLPYLSRETHQFTAHKESLWDHVEKELAYIKDNFLHDTYLSCYGDGDWDDTLQPHDAKLKTYMASSWTVGLTYKGVKGLASALKDAKPEIAAELLTLAGAIEGDFRKYIMTTDVIPGFLYLENPEKPELMIHPTDEKLGIDYRLLPMQQSMISELFTPEEAGNHLAIIRKHLQCPDGVRLMNKPATYAGGVSTKFKRAEQASNFGREVGLQYVHAHIRFIEAMAKLGEVDEAWNGLKVIHPINIKDSVPNAEIRQSNAYFSSSDGKFNTRYAASAGFDQLRTGEVAVKGGWRVYSSGPGIYLNQLISNVLGIRQLQNMIQIDPVLPTELDGLTLKTVLAGKSVEVVYHLGSGNEKIAVNGETVGFNRVGNKYRDGGFEISVDLLTNEENVIEIWL